MAETIHWFAPESVQIVLKPGPFEFLFITQCIFKLPFEYNNWNTLGRGELQYLGFYIS